MSRFHDNLDPAGIPMFGKNGTFLTQEDRAAIAKKKGICLTCGIQTHQGKNLFRKGPLTNDDVHKGICIRCNPNAVPPNIYSAWQSRQTPTQPARPRVMPPSKQHQSQMNLSPQPAANRSPRSPRRIRSAHPPATGADVPPAARSPPAAELRKAQSSAEVAFRDTGVTSFAGASKSQPDLKYRKGDSEREEHVQSHLKQPQLSQPEPKIPLVEENLKATGVEDAAVIVAGLRDHSDRPDLIIQHLHNLRNLGDDSASAMNEIPRIMRSYESNSHVLRAAAGAIWSVTCQSHAKKVETIENGVADAVLNALRLSSSTSDDDAAAWLLGCFATLSTTRQVRDFLVQNGGIDTVIEVLERLSSSSVVFEWACRALSAVLFRPEDDGNSGRVYEKDIETVLNAGGIESVVHAMKTHIDETDRLSWAISFLCLLLAGKGTAKNAVDEMNRSDCVSLCITVADSNEGKTASILDAVELMHHLLIYGGASVAGLKGQACAQVCTKLVSNYADDKELLASCARVLSDVAISSSDFRYEALASPSLPILLNAAESDPLNVDLIVPFFSILWSLTSLPSSMGQEFISRSHRLVSSIIETSSHVSDSIYGFVANQCLKKQQGDLNVDKILDIATHDTNGPGRTRFLSAVQVCFPELAKASFDTRSIDASVEKLSGVDSSIRKGALTSLVSHVQSSPSTVDYLREGGRLNGVVAALSKSQSVDETLLALELMSSVLVLKDGPKKYIQFPEGVLASIMTAMSKFPPATLPGCGVIRDIFLAVVPGFSPPRSDGLVECLVKIIDAEQNALDVRLEAVETLWVFVAVCPDQESADLREMFRSVLTIMGKHRGDDTPYNSQVQTVGSGALAAVMRALRLNPIHISDNDIDLIACILDLVVECDVQNVDVIIRLLDVVLSLSFLYKELVVQFGVIVVVIDCMVDHEQNETIQEKGCAILALLASTENLQVNLSIAETDGIDLLVSSLALYTSNYDIQLNACRALSHLSIDHESRMLISSQGGLILLVNAAKSFADDEDLLEATCSALLNLSSDAEDQVLAGSNMVETAIAIAHKQPDSAVLQEKVLGIIQNVSMRSKDAKKEIADVGGIDVVTVAIREFMGSPSVLERAFTTMWSLGVLEENQVRIADCGGISLLVNGMMANIQYEKVQKQACGCLCTLSSNSRNKSLIRDEGGVDSIVYSMWAHYGSEALQVEACRALSSLAVNVQTNEVMVASDGEIQAIMGAMKRFPDSERVQEHACVALRNFLLSADNVELMRSSQDDVRSLMRHAAARFPERCSQRAQQVIASLR